MEIAIAMQHAPREIRLDIDAKPEDVRKQVEKAFAADEKILWLTDTDGKQTAIPLAKIAYLEIGRDRSSKQVGFAIRD